jgi:hypothetical protein
MLQFTPGRVLVLAVAAVACTVTPPAPSRTVVHSDCGTDGPYEETVTSSVSDATPAPRSTVHVRIAVRRLQIDVGPMREGRYVFPVPAGVRITGVRFADQNPNQWAVQGGELTVRFLGPEGGWLVNDFPEITVVAELSSSLAPGATITWLPYSRFEQHFVSIDRPLACTVRPPVPALQTMTVA